MSIQKWSNVPGSITVESEFAELVIAFESSGYRDSGSMYGGSAGVGWPPEGEDERTVTGACLLFDSDEPGQPVKVRLPKEAAVQIGAQYADQIAAAELDGQCV